MKVDIEEIGLAYRRAKADLYYTHNANLIKIARYEEQLVSNLRRIHSSLERDATEEITSAYCHGWRVVPKAIVFADDNDDSKSHSTVRLSDDAHDVSDCYLRLIEDLPIDFHVVTQLWIDRVAAHYEQQMSKNSYGNRLRMNNRKVNIKYPGSFKYWMEHYRKWHDGGLEKIESALQDKKDVIVLTTDFSSFFHCLTPQFILDKAFLNALGVNLSKEDVRLTELVVKMLVAWAGETPIGRGLPVGCGVSSVIANIALTLLDRKLESLPGVVYYGRYVDDIILAIENTRGLRDQEEMISYLCEEIPEIVKCGKMLSYQPKLSRGLNFPNVGFNQEKTRVFVFDKRDGLGFVDSLRTQVKKRSSEWRALPDLPDNAIDLVRSIVSITDRSGVEVGKLREAEEISIRRAAFAMKLADFDDYASCLKPGDWKIQRIAFLDAVAKYFTNAKSYFELYKYFPRLISIAVHGLTSSDSQTTGIIAEIFARVGESISKATSGVLHISGMTSDPDTPDYYWELLRFQICRSFCEAVVAAVDNAEVRADILLLISKSFPDCTGSMEGLLEYNALFVADLAREPFKSLLFSVNDIKPRFLDVAQFAREGIGGLLPVKYNTNGVRLLQDNAEWGRMIVKGVPPSGLLFPTRKMSEVELYAIMREPYHVDLGGRGIIAEYLQLQGFGISLDQMIAFSRKGSKLVHVEIPDQAPDDEKQKPGDRKIALAYWCSSNNDWQRQIDGKIDADRPKRFSRLMRLTNLVLRSKERPDYMMFHELALPWRWFLLMAKKLAKSRISLISGVEYLRSPRAGKLVRNEAWCALRRYIANYQSQILIRVLKTCPAEEERLGLRKQDYCLDTLRTAGTFRSGDVIIHGDARAGVFFSVVICSDLTDINIRARLRGRIDLVNVLAWNLDIKTFNALVTATAYDLHAYVAMANNGVYGDTRIRAPYMNDYDRDVVQLKGGCNDYFVIGTIKAHALRRFHKGCPSPKDPKYKPLPTGFKMSKMREDLVKPEVINQSHLQYALREGSQIVVRVNKENGKWVEITKLPLSALKTKERVLNELTTLISKPLVTKEVLADFLRCCRDCVGVNVFME